MARSNRLLSLESKYEVEDQNQNISLHFILITHRVSHGVLFLTMIVRIDNNTKFLPQVDTPVCLITPFYVESIISQIKFNTPNIPCTRLSNTVHYEVFLNSSSS